MSDIFIKCYARILPKQLVCYSDVFFVHTVKIYLKNYRALLTLASHVDVLTGSSAITPLTRDEPLRTFAWEAILTYERDGHYDPTLKHDRKATTLKIATNCWIAASQLIPFFRQISLLVGLNVSLTLCNSRRFPRSSIPLKFLLNLIKNQNRSLLKALVV